MRFLQISMPACRVDFLSKHRGNFFKFGHQFQYLFISAKQKTPKNRVVIGFFQNFNIDLEIASNLQSALKTSPAFTSIKKRNKKTLQLCAIFCFFKKKLTKKQFAELIKLIRKNDQGQGSYHSRRHQPKL